MSLTTNTASLQAILDTVNALPEAGSGGAVVETCTVTINFITSNSWQLLNLYEYTTLRDGAIIHELVDAVSKSYMGGSTSVTLENIVCNSLIVIDYDTMGESEITTDGDIYLSMMSLMGRAQCCVETAAGGIITITA